ncbi:MAG TPA: NDP-sugar synthase [Vicinamibacterales bacterium]|nr:NDP-sugar synthase [Vicinamibacterales bacterium]
MTGVDRALVLTAGLGTRLRPLSLARAKAALPVAGVPLAVRILRWLAASGVTEAVLNLHYRPETIAREIGDGGGTGLRVRYSWEQPLLGSAGGPRKALSILETDRFLVINGDTLTDVPLSAVVEAHERSGALVTMALIPNPRPEYYGGVVVRDDVVCGFTNTGPNFHFIGVQVVEATVFAGVPDDRPSSSIGALYPSLIKARPDAIRAFICDASFDDIGTPSDYLETSLRVAAQEHAAHSLRGADCTIHSGAHVTRSVLWDRVDVGDGASLVECVVADDVAVPPGARFERQAVVRGEQGVITAPL